MFSLLLAVIYASFISLGLPDSLLGAAWPVMREQLNLPVSYAGIVTMIIAGGTIASSLMSDRLTRRLGAGLVTALSVLTTAGALAGFALARSFGALCLLAVPYGLGAGAVDAALNNYVAVNYASRHMSWLHCFWGLGASISPYIMGASISGAGGWRGGYGWVAVIQLVLTVLIFASLPLWKKRATEADAPPAGIGNIAALRIPGVKGVLAAFFCYCGLETTAGLWAGSYFVYHLGISETTAAALCSVYYLGITAGRFLSGFVADRLGDRRLIRIGTIIALAGIACTALPLRGALPAAVGLAVVGLGCAPIYPSVIHATPVNFGRENSQTVIGLQMAGAYVGTTLVPPLFGFIGGRIGIGLYPAFLALFALMLLAACETVNRRIGIAGRTPPARDG